MGRIKNKVPVPYKDGVPLGGVATGSRIVPNVPPPAARLPSAAEKMTTSNTLREPTEAVPMQSKLPIGPKSPSYCIETEILDEATVPNHAERLKAVLSRAAQQLQDESPCPSRIRPYGSSLLPTTVNGNLFVSEIEAHKQIDIFDSSEEQDKEDKEEFKSTSLTKQTKTTGSLASMASNTSFPFKTIRGIPPVYALKRPATSLSNRYSSVRKRSKTGGANPKHKTASDDEHSSRVAIHHGELDKAGASKFAAAESTTWHMGGTLGLPRSGKMHTTSSHRIQTTNPQTAVQRNSVLGPLELDAQDWIIGGIDTSEDDIEHEQEGTTREQPRAVVDITASSPPSGPDAADTKWARDRRVGVVDDGGAVGSENRACEVASPFTDLVAGQVVIELSSDEE